MSDIPATPNETTEYTNSMGEETNDASDGRLPKSEQRACPVEDDIPDLLDAPAFEQIMALRETLTSYYVDGADAAWHDLFESILDYIDTYGYDASDIS